MTLTQLIRNIQIGFYYVGIKRLTINISYNQMIKEGDNEAES